MVCLANIPSITFLLPAAVAVIQEHVVMYEERELGEKYLRHKACPAPDPVPTSSKYPRSNRQEAMGAKAVLYVKADHVQAVCSLPTTSRHAN